MVTARSIWSLARVDDPQISQALVNEFAGLSPQSQSASLSTLASRLSFAGRLVNAMESGKIAPTAVPAYIVRQVVDFDTSVDGAEFRERLENVWGRIGSGASTDEQTQQFVKYQKILTRRAIQDADASLGRKLYEANCGKCHKMFGAGSEIGPDITGANRTNVDDWLENILQPNTLIGRDYLLTNMLLNDGRVIAGIVKSENEDAVTLQTAEESIVVAKSAIDERLPSDVSLMPSGQLETMSEKDVRALFKYLMAPSQVPLPDSH